MKLSIGKRCCRSTSGYTDRALAVMAVFATADEWGLNPDDFSVPPLPDDAPDATPLSREERIEAESKFSLNVLKYARYARGGRIFEPSKQLSSYLDRGPQFANPLQVILDVAEAQKPGDVLRNLHPKHPQFEKLRQKYLEITSKRDEADKIVRIPAGPKLIPGKKHPQVAMLRRRLDVPAAAVAGWPADENHYDDKLAAAVAKFQDERGQKADGIVGSKTRAALNDIEAPSPEKYLANMEHWRWMPEDLGNFYVWVNIPDFMVRVVKDGKIVHEERIVVGELDKQTPVFSDVMETIYFNPRWNVPESIKVLELYPSLARGGGSFQRQGLKLMRNGKPVNPGSVDWSRADIRNYDVYQPSGPGNVLGVVKFTFPNKHAVYLHDTTAKSLFNEASRPFSHGCMRVRNPMRLAEVLLENDKGWNAAQVHETQQSSDDEVPVKLSSKIPVHVTYLTTLFDDAGNEQTFKDIYGHEKRLKLAIAGKFDQIVKGPDHLAPVKLQRVRYASSPDDWSFFGGSFSTKPGNSRNNADVLIKQKNGKTRYKKDNSSFNDFLNNMFGGY
jgi:L,D-transpeptidase YcbB